MSTINVASDQTDARLTCDLHTHTCYSRDCLTTLPDFLETCRRRRLDRVAVTDHNTIAGAVRLQQMDPQRIIVGEEILTTQGELIAYFLTEPVPAGLSPQHAIAAVRDQGGVIGASHPLDRYRREAVGRAKLLPLLGRLDFLEGFNARCILHADNRAAQDLAQARGLPTTAGSDAHSRWELGRAVTLLPLFDGPTSFLESLPEGQIAGRMTPFWIHFVSVYAKLARRRGWVPLPGDQGGR